MFSLNQPTSKWRQVVHVPSKYLGVEVAPSSQIVTGLILWAVNAIATPSFDGVKGQ